MITTIETRLKLDKQQELTIDSCVNLWSEYYRKTWVMLNNKHLEENVIWHKLMDSNLFTSNQVDSLLNKVKTEHSKIKELTKTQLKNHISKLDNINKFINKSSKSIVSLNKDIIKLKKELTLYKRLNNTTKLKDIYSKLTKTYNSIKNKQLIINSKSIKIKRLNKSINLLQSRINNNTFKLCFGSSTLLKQRPSNHADKFRLNDNQKPYKNITDWQKDWNLSRNNIILSIGRKTKPQGNAEIQYYPDNKTLRFRVTDKQYLTQLLLISKELKVSINDLNDNTNIGYGIYRMQARFITIENVEFCEKNLAKLNQVINSKPITAKIMKKLTPNGKDIGFYLQLSFDEVVMDKVILSDRPKTIGIDLNQKGLAYCIVKADGNKLNKKDISKINNNHKSSEFIYWDLENKTTEQREWLISNAITEVLNIAQEYGVYSIAIENLDFSSTVNNMNSGYKTKSSAKGFNYNVMLSSFAKTKFKELIIRKSERLGMTVSLVNPNYSSIGGYAKYGITNKLSVDIAAGLWLARQSIYGKEFKQENGVKFKKSYKEAITFPYGIRFKQSNKSKLNKVEWKDIASALRTDRKLWYKISIINIKPNVGKEENQFNPFELIT